MVPDSPDVEEVLTGEEGVLAHAEPGAYWIDASTIRPDVAMTLANKAREAGLKPLDAPVSGGEQGAVDGALSIMVGGEQDDFDAVREVFDTVGKTIVLVGPSVRAGPSRPPTSSWWQATSHCWPRQWCFSRLTGSTPHLLCRSWEAGRLQGSGSEGPEDAGQVLRPWVPPRAASQRYGHRHSRCSRSRSGDPTGRIGCPTGPSRCPAGQWEPGPLRALRRRRAALWPSRNTTAVLIAVRTLTDSSKKEKRHG